MSSFGLAKCVSRSSSRPSACALARFATSSIAPVKITVYPATIASRAERHSQVRLADARRTEQQQRIAVGDEAAGGEVADLRAVKRGLGGEVEAGNVPHERELRQTEAHVDAALILPGDLALAEERQRIAQGQLRAHGFVEEAAELIAHRRQLQPRQHPVEVVLRVCVHHHAPPATASYSASGRIVDRSHFDGVAGAAGRVIRQDAVVDDALMVMPALLRPLAEYEAVAGGAW